jgi:hypothetical protein
MHARQRDDAASLRRCVSTRLACGRRGLALEAKAAAVTMIARAAVTFPTPQAKRQDAVCRTRPEPARGPPVPGTSLARQGNPSPCRGEGQASEARQGEGAPALRRALDLPSRRRPTHIRPARHRRGNFFRTKGTKDTKDTKRLRRRSRTDFNSTSKEAPPTAMLGPLVPLVAFVRFVRTQCSLGRGTAREGSIEGIRTPPRPTPAPGRTRPRGPPRWNRWCQARARHVTGTGCPLRRCREI